MNDFKIRGKMRKRKGKNKEFEGQGQKGGSLATLPNNKFIRSSTIVIVTSILTHFSSY